MNRPAMKRKCLTQVAACVVLSLVIGCAAQSGKQPTKKKKDTKPVAKNLEQIAYESFQARDVLRAEKLRALKGTKFDGKRIDAIAKAGAEASEETWKPVATALSRKLDSIPQDDQEAFDAVLEQLAKAAEKAGAQ